MSFIFSCTKGLVTSEDLFNVLNQRVSQSEDKGVDLEVTLQELKDWPHIDQPKTRGTREGEQKV